jgi:hypothetical protein
VALAPEPIDPTYQWVANPLAVSGLDGRQLRLLLAANTRQAARSAWRCCRW